MGLDAWDLVDQVCQLSALASGHSRVRTLALAGGRYAYGFRVMPASIVL